MKTAQSGGNSSNGGASNFGVALPQNDGEPKVKMSKLGIQVPGSSVLPAPSVPSLSANPKNLLNPVVGMSCPIVVGEFSLDSTREPKLGRAGVRYICEKFITAGNREPKVHLNLSANYSTFISSKHDEMINVILRWIQKMCPPKSNLKKVLHEADFLIWRGTLTRLGVSPFDVVKNGTGIKIACCKFKGVIFICEYETESKRRVESGQGDKGKMMSYWGHKFEQYITSENLNGMPNTSEPVSEFNEFCAMFKTEIGPKNESFRVLYGAEVDCINPKGEYLEIKTQFNEVGFGHFFDSKAMKWWLQSYLANIKTLVIGLRDQEGFVNRVELLPVDQLPKKWSKTWQYDKCISFIHVFLKYVSQTLSTLPDDMMLIAERLPTSYEFRFDVVNQNEQPYDFLTKEFSEHFD
uniref:Decapping nuclease n=1 Tax=Ditylenchus dipsaci TaxID=166011 RepID=A0A915EPI0_9BILA